MIQDHDPPLPGALPTTLFDAWVAPFTAWANWCSLCAEALQVAQAQNPDVPLLEDTAPVHVEDEEGLVA